MKQNAKKHIVQNAYEKVTQNTKCKYIHENQIYTQNINISKIASIMHNIKNIKWTPQYETKYKKKHKIQNIYHLQNHIQNKSNSTEEKNYMYTNFICN